MCLPFVLPGSKPSIRAEQRSMNATSISFGLLIVLFTILLLHRMRKLKPLVAGFQSQRMCPPCGLITSTIKGKLLGVWQALYSGRVTRLQRNNRRLAQASDNLSFKDIRYGNKPSPKERLAPVTF